MSQSTVYSTIAIDLRGCETDRDLLALFGEVFAFGGPEGNVRVRGNDRRGWGMNWDALNDCLTCLDEGGIWGSSPVYRFPLQLRLAGVADFASRQPRACQILREILEATRAFYALRGDTFEYVIDADRH